jgi:hypothetical protein
MQLEHLLPMIDMLYKVHRSCVSVYVCVYVAPVLARLCD